MTNPSDQPNLKTAQSILWMVPERLGDALMSTAALQRLHAARPELRMDLLAFSETSAGVYRHNPAITRHHLNPTARDFDALSREHELVVHAHPDVDLPRLSTIPLPWTAPENPAPEKHQAQVQWEFIGTQLGLPDAPPSDYTLMCSPDDEALLAQLLHARHHEPARDLLIGCSIGCNRMARRGLKFWKPLTHPKVWPITRLHQLDALLRQHNPSIRLVLIGAGSETILARDFCRKSPRTINLTGLLPVPALAALMKRLNAVLTGDTGLLHVACTAPKPLLALHGATRPERSGPFPPAPFRRIIRAESMHAISPECVCTELLDLLAAT